MLKESRDFISRGNAVDLAVCLVISATFGTFWTALVKNLTAEIIAALLAKLAFLGLPSNHSNASL